MTFEEWWDGESIVIATPETFRGWEESCRQAWDAATKAEREECAKICDGHSADASFLVGDYAAGCENEAASCAAAIRVRSNLNSTTPPDA